MHRYEYKVIPAPKKGLKAPGVKSTEARFANALTEVMNEYGAEGWEFQRSDTLPGESRSGMAKKITTYQSVLVFRRALVEPESSTDDETSDETLRTLVLTPVNETAEDISPEKDTSDEATSEEPTAAQ